jgi:hypothetical protein
MMCCTCIISLWEEKKLKIPPDPRKSFNSQYSPTELKYIHSHRLAHMNPEHSCLIYIYKVLDLKDIKQWHDNIVSEVTGIIERLCRFDVYWM